MRFMLSFPLLSSDPRLGGGNQASERRVVRSSELARCGFCVGAQTLEQKCPQSARVSPITTLESLPTAVFPLPPRGALVEQAQGTNRAIVCAAFLLSAICRHTHTQPTAKPTMAGAAEAESMAVKARQASRKLQALSTAERVAMLDLVSGGRADFGAGGWGGVRI